MINDSIPVHVGIIMDGNGRWAKNKGLPRSLGHKKGAENLEKLIKHIFGKCSIRFLSVYAFSTENFDRDKKEVDFLMDLFVKWFKKALKTFSEENIKMVFSGKRDRLSKKVLDVMNKLEDATKDNINGVVNFAIDYGGQTEIVDVVKKISKLVKDGNIKIDEIDKELINNNLYNVLPPLDFVIRTSGELRISNFMLWQSAYAEYYFPETLFPDFDSNEFDKAIIEYSNRNRRFGGVKDESKTN